MKMELDNDKDSLVSTFSALTLAADDYANASGDVEKTQIGTKVAELLFEIQRMLTKCNAAFIAAAFTPSMCKNWCFQLSRMPTNSDQYDMTRAILITCLASIAPPSFFAQYASVLASNLVLPKASSESKEFILKEISKAIERADVDTIRQFGSAADGQNVLASVSECITDGEISAADAAGKCLAIFCRRHAIGTSLLFSSEPVVQRLRGMLKGSEIIRFRLHEFIAAVCTISPESLNLCVSHGFLDALLNEVDSNDILCQLNAMTILTDMAGPKSGSDHCLRYFRDKGFLQKLNGMLLISQEAPDASFLFPAVIKFFGHLSRLYPKECCEDFPLFLSCVFDLVVNYNRLDVGQRLLAFDTLALIGSTPGGKIILAKHDEAMKKCMSCFGNSFKQGPIELRVRHIEALGSLIQLKESDQTNDLLALTQRWFTWLECSGRASDSCQLFFDLFRQPFPEVHLAAGQIFKVLAVQSWARTLMAQQAGFLEYLLNRTTENTMDGRYIKYEIVKCLTEAPSITEAFDSADVIRLKEYVQEGPMYVKAQPANVAFQEA